MKYEIKHDGIITRRKKVNEMKREKYDNISSYKKEMKFEVVLEGKYKEIIEDQNEDEIERDIVENKAEAHQLAIKEFGEWNYTLYKEKQNKIKTREEFAKDNCEVIV